MSTIEQFPIHPPDEPTPRLIQIDNPVAGAEIVYNCPHTHRFKILGIKFLLTADANAANRQVDLVVTQGITNFFRANFDLVHTANMPYTYQIVPGQIQPIFTIGLERWCPAPFPLYLFYGQNIHTVTENLQVGDQFSLIYLYGFGWPDFVNNPPA